MVVAVLLAAVVLFVVVPSGRMTRASSAERPRSGLLEQVPDLVVTDCGHPFEGSAVVRFPAGRFDRDQLVRVTAGDRQGWASGGGELFPTTSTVVRVHVPAGTPDGDYPVTVSAAGRHHGQPTELKESLAVRVRCSAR
jgi:hypothetical protein